MNYFIYLLHIRQKYSRIYFLHHDINMADARKILETYVWNPGCFGGFPKHFQEPPKNHPIGALKRFRALEVLGSFEKRAAFRKLRYQPKILSFDNGFPPNMGRKWQRFQYANANYPGLFFRPPGSGPCRQGGGERVPGLD